LGIFARIDKAGWQLGGDSVNRGAILLDQNNVVVGSFGDNADVVREL
jgi:hypothetical protein